MSNKPTTTAEQQTHRDWLSMYNETVHTASSTYPAPLTDPQREAYLSLPDLIQFCLESWLAIPDPLRSMHYLVGC